jgi:hypothetical protein
LTEEQQREREEAEEQERLYRAQCLQAADQLPELPDGDLNLVWDQEEGQTLIRSGDTVIWSEPLAYEAFDRFERIALILKEKYGVRIKDLSPTNRSMLFLYGDYYPSMEYVTRLRKDIFGASDVQ